MTSTMESHTTMQEASDQQARCKKQQKTRRMPRAHSNLHTPTCTPQLNLHFDSAKHAYVTNNRSKAESSEPEIVATVFFETGPTVVLDPRATSTQLFSSHAQQAPKASQDGFPTAICLAAIAAAHDEAARKKLFKVFTSARELPNAPTTQVLAGPTRRRFKGKRRPAAL